MASLDHSSIQNQPGTDSLWHGTSKAETDHGVTQDNSTPVASNNSTTTSSATTFQEQAAGLAESAKASKVRGYHMS